MGTEPSTKNGDIMKAILGYTWLTSGSNYSYGVLTPISWENIEES
jgi:hypothetical protein